MRFLIFPFIIFFLFSNAAGAQYTSIPDPNFEHFLEANGMGDGVGNNGQVLTENIENVAELLIPPSEISDLTGIQDFSSLEIFSCVINPISELDLSQNTHLKIIAFLQLFNLNNVDVTALEELEEIHFNQNLFNSVKLGFHPNLKILDVSENSLTTLDVSQCPILEELNIRENYISGIDVSNNLNLQHLTTILNPLTSIDTSHNTNLKIYWGGDDFITEYDFTQNPNLVNFSVSVSNNLTHIDMRNGNNHLVEYFYISQSPSLNCIFVDDSSAPYLEEWEIFEEGVYFVNSEEECEALQTQDFFAQELQIYPNPVHDKLNILNPDLQITSVQITDVSGKLISEQKTSTEKFEIDFSRFPKGMYFISAETNGKKLKTKKIIKK